MADDLLKGDDDATLAVECAAEAAKRVSSDSELSLDELENVSAGFSPKMTIVLGIIGAGTGSYFNLKDN